MSREPEGELTTGRVSNNAKAGPVDPIPIRQSEERVSGSDEIVKGAGPAAPRIADSPVLDVSGRGPGRGQRVAEMPYVQKIIPGSLKTAVDHDQTGVRAKAGGKSEIDELQPGRSVGEPMISRGSGLGKNSITHHVAPLGVTGLTFGSHLPVQRSDFTRVKLPNVEPWLEVRGSATR